MLQGLIDNIDIWRDNDIVFNGSETIARMQTLYHGRLVWDEFLCNAHNTTLYAQQNFYINTDNAAILVCRANYVTVWF